MRDQARNHSEWYEITKETAELAKVFVRTAAVIKSNEPRFSMEQVMDKLRSGILGNTQAIDDLGKYLAMWTEKIEHTVNDEVIDMLRSKYENK